VNSFAIVPARKGSKRILSKNTRLLHGVPLFERTLRNLIDSNVFSEIFITSNDEQIHNISEKFGVRHDFYRDEFLCDDFTPTQPVIQDAITKYKISDPHSLVCVVYPTSVLYNHVLLSRSFEVATKLTFLEMLQTVGRYSHPIERAFSRSEDGTLSALFPEFANTRTQDLASKYFDAGQGYWATQETWLSDSKNWKRSSFVLLEHEYQDLDNEEDWKMLEIKCASKFIGAEACKKSDS
jgi:CMP-N-acetylneuraminic acid synthetase